MPSLRILTACLVILAVANELSSAQTEAVSFDPETGYFSVTYLGFGDSIHEAILVPGDLIDPNLRASTVKLHSPTRYQYDFVLQNGDSAMLPIYGLSIDYFSPIDTINVPNSDWESFDVQTYSYARWANTQNPSVGIQPDSTESGFSLVSDGLPTFSRAYVSNVNGISYDDEGPSSWVLGVVDSLLNTRSYRVLPTIGPRDPPTPLDLGDFLDTLATYPLRAAAQGWIADSTAGDLDRLLGDATTALSGGDSTWAATLLATVRNHVETVKDDSLSSEGYALMKYNIDYALAYLPAVIEVKAFLQGAYSAGQLTKNILDYIPSTQPFGDSLDVWKYNGPERLTRVPSFITDWVLVSAAVLAPDTMLVGHGAALLDDQGVATVAVGSNLPDSVYVVVEHRNHIMVMSDTLVDVSSGHAEHDFTTGHAFKATAEPQKRIVSGQDTVYVMWTADGDGSADGQVTALDFVAWLAATTAGATGYVPTDFNLDGQVTALDFTDWLVNTTAGAKRGVLEAIHGLIVHKSTGVITQMGIAAQSEGGGPQAYVRLVVTRDTGHDFWVDIEAKSDSSALPENTVAGAVLDVYYDDTELSLASADVGVLDLDAGYANNVSDSEEEGRRFIRVEFRARENQYPWHDLATDWEVVSSLHFSRTPPPHDDGTSIRRYTLAMAFYDKHSNIDASYAYHQIVIEVQ